MGERVLSGECASLAQGPGGTIQDRTETPFGGVGDKCDVTYEEQQVILREVTFKVAWRVGVMVTR